MFRRLTSLIEPPYGKWKVIRVLLLIFSLIWLVSRCAQLIGPTAKLQLRRTGAISNTDGKFLHITNIGGGPVKITAVAINDRADCKAEIFRILVPNEQNQFPTVLQVGEDIPLMSECRIIRATVDSDQGSSTYSFD